jgi:large subunit ribosomal protein L21
MQSSILRAAASRANRCVVLRHRLVANTPALSSLSSIQDPHSNGMISVRIPSRTYSSTFQTSSGKYAVVDHSAAYEAAMQGAHGKQLALARLEGLGKDDPPFDPFSDDDDYDSEDYEGELEEEVGEDEDEIPEAELVGDEEEDVEEEYDEEVAADDMDGMEASPYNRDGSVRRKKSVKATLRAGFPAGGQFAVIRIAGAQHKVTTDDLIVSNKLKPVEKYNVGSVHTLSDVLLVGSSHLTLVGLPIVPGAEVDVMVEEITRDAKVVVFKKRRRKHSERRNGFRRDVTLLRVLDIRFPEDHRDHNHVSRDILKELEESATNTSSGFADEDEEAAPIFDVDEQGDRKKEKTEI